jgi:methionine synthase I (cobalamin-dependent)/5,10-methylenetetrahydrofolate reductase
MNEPSIRTSPTFLERIKSGQPILSDGAMGTTLHQRGTGFDVCFDELNLSNPALVAEVQREYIDAGSQMIQTNTFGANRFKLARHGFENKVEEINRAGVELARRTVLASYKPILIAGDIGPLGIRLAPFGRVQPEQAYQAFLEQASALAAAGVDLFIIETMTDLFEVREAINACRKAAPDLPIIASMTYTRDDRTLLGDTPAKVARQIYTFGADVIGVNCSGGPNQLLRILRQMREAVPQASYSCMPNAGWPEQVSGRIMYPAASDYFGDYALSFWKEGATVLGGCCGTTPEHIAVMAKALKNVSPRQPAVQSLQIKVEPENQVKAQLPPSPLADKITANKFVIAVEMDPPRGLATHKLLAGASLLAEAGADVINVADSPMARMRMSPWAVCSLIQNKIGVETILHFPTRGRNLLRVQGDLLAAHALDVRNVFVVMGDPTAIGDYPDAMDNFDLVPSGLVKLIKQNFNTGIDQSGADIGQPTNFLVGCALNLNAPDLDKEIKVLRKKISAGADFLMTQPIYDSTLLVNFLDRYHELFGKLDLPLWVGCLPLASSRHAAFLHNEVPGITIPETVRSRMDNSSENGSETGRKIALDFIETVRSMVQGVYLMPAFNRYDIVADIIDQLK